MSEAVEQIAATALRDWLLLQLPAKVAEVNLFRAAVLLCPWAGPFNVPAGSTLGIGVTAGSDTVISVPLTTGAARTSAQIAANINAAAGLVGMAAVDSAGRWYVTSPTPPSASTDSKVILRKANGTTDINNVFGFDQGGERDIRSALLAPPRASAFDGWPITPVFAPRSAKGAYIAFVVGDRRPVPASGGPRRDQYTVAIDLSVLRMDVAEQHRSREAISSAVRCVREVLLQDAGRMLGRAGAGDVQLVEEVAGGLISSVPLNFNAKKDSNPLYDAALLQLSVKIYQRPSAT